MSADPDSSLLQVDLIEPHGDRLCDAQGVPVHDEQQSVVTSAVPAVLSCLEQALHFRWIQVVLSRSWASTAALVTLRR